MKRDIVISNHFTHKDGSTSGTRGATPGQFVLRYMSRDEKGATEPLAPFGMDVKPDLRSLTRYRAREREAVSIKSESLDFDELMIKRRLKSLDGLGGRSFGSRNLSLSDKELRDDSDKIQKAFDENHAVQLMVVSFSEQFLREYNVLDDDFKYIGDGSYKNNYDQMKLRIALNQGLTEMTDVGKYANPLWVGTLQVDTSHLHAHIALCDTEFSDKRKHISGFDRGKIRENEKEAMRHGISHSLELMSSYKFYHKNNQKDKQHVMGLIKDVDFHEASYNHELQLIYGSLPEDQSRWTVDDNSGEMRFANELSRNFVRRLFDEYGDATGYDKAVTDLKIYASSQDNPEQLIANGVRSIEDKAVNAIYSQLSMIEEERKIPKDGLLYVQSMDTDELKQAVMERGDVDEEFDQFGFELRLRAYRERTGHHLKRVNEYHSDLVDYDASNGSSDSQVMRDYYLNEMLYHAKVVDKYRSFTAYEISWDDSDREFYDTISKQYDAIQDAYVMQQMTPDDVAFDMGYDSAQDALMDRTNFVARCERQYGFKDGDLLLRESTRNVFDARIRSMQDVYEGDNKSYAYSVFMNGGLTSRELESVYDNPGNAPYPPQAGANLYDEQLFDSVNSLDLHDMDVDFYGIGYVGFSKESIDKYTDSFNSRLSLYQDANEYLVDTNQPISILRHTQDDLLKIKSTLDKLYDGSYDIPPLILEDVEEKQRNSETMSLDKRVPVIQVIHDELEFS